MIGPIPWVAAVAHGILALICAFVTLFLGSYGTIAILILYPNASAGPAALDRALDAQGHTLLWMVTAGWLGWLGATALMAWSLLSG